jgi:hypothetical protein
MTDFYEDDGSLAEVDADTAWFGPGTPSRKPPRCDNNGGQGIGAGHVCRCIRETGHPDDSDRPHGCPCGAVW